LFDAAANIRTSFSPTDAVFIAFRIEETSDENENDMEIISTPHVLTA
jgi:hypothetical protein